MKRLSRVDLRELLVEIGKENDRLKTELDKVRQWILHYGGGCSKVRLSELPQ